MADDIEQRHAGPYTRTGRLTGCVMLCYIIHMGFGSHIRSLREARGSRDKAFSLRKVARRAGIAANYLSKIEREQVPPPSEDVVLALARELGQNPDVLLAAAGRVSSRLKEAIMKRPQAFAELIMKIDGLPEEAVLRVVREVRDGKW
jgi:transcriptional regulator with XRE-family HTH domain